jgi:threonine/homoserine/homoserine lactone efflux protein
MDDVSTYLPDVILAYTTFFIAIASPGPNILAVLGTSVSVGRRSGIALALGVAAGSLCWAMLSVLGLSALLASYAAALRVIKLAGGCYLLWLAYKSFRSAASRYDLATRTLPGSPRSALGYALRGLTIQMTNPKAALAWIAIMSLGLREGAPLWVPVSLVVGTSLLSVLIHCVYAVAFSTAVMLRFYSRARRSIQATVGALFAFAGMKLLTSRS